MKEIKLTQGMVALVDEEDFEYLNQFKWFAHKGGKTFYAERHDNINGKDVKIKMHRELLGMTLYDGNFADHINHNGLDNRRENIRNCTHQENCRNRRKRNGSTSIHKGVLLSKTKYFSKRKNEIILYIKWKAEIEVDDKSKSLGYFKTEEDAAMAYNNAALTYFGEFACLNTLSNENNKLI